MMTNAAKLLRIVMSCGLIAQVSGCGGGGDTPNPGSSGTVTTFQVSATAGTGGTISPASVTVNAGSTTTLNVTPKRGYVVIGVTGCAGSLAGTTYTTATINSTCTVTANFAAAFTWVGGSSSPDANGVYGVQGVAAATNMPGSRDAGITWTDVSGNLWLFGGFSGYTGALDPAVGNFLNELWKYSPTSGQWTWVGGSNTNCPKAVYGTQNVAAATNVPGARVGSLRWMDAGGTVWLFGGAGCDSSGAFIFYDDFWQFSPSSSEWTWIGGSTTPSLSPVYGTEGIAAATNTPGARNSAGTWMDAHGNMFMFGGEGIPTPSYSGDGAFYNDLWEYLPSSNEWVWIGGPNISNEPGVYGAQGVADGANVPGARISAVSWTDPEGNFWLFGGWGYDSTGVQQRRALLNDLWEYSPATGKWTWVGGANTGNATGVYGTKGVAAAVNWPSARNGAVGWTDANGNLWLFGGTVLDSPTQSYHRVNDLWEYSPASGQWTWVAGSGTLDGVGVYGTQGMAAATNMPGARASPSAWRDPSGNVWLFGGLQWDGSTNIRFEMNDLWMYPAAQ